MKYGILTFMAFILVLVPLALHAQDQYNTIMIPIDQWTNSGVYVTSGQTVSIWANGWALFNPQTNRNLNYAGPGGRTHTNPGHPVPTAATYCLIARIGASGTPLGIGTYHEFVATSSGDLYFSVNDGYIFDNQGFFTAIVARDGVLWPNIPPSVDDQTLISPTFHQLNQNFPNPFNPTTTINYSLTMPGEISIKIYNNMGQLVRNLVNEEKSPGEYTIVWDGTSDDGTRVATGTYFYQLQSGDRIEAKKMILLK